MKSYAKIVLFTKHMIYIYIIFILNSFYCFSYDLSICAIFQNESRFLREWIEFHQNQGVEKFYLYNNNSSDDYQHALQPFIDQSIVELIDWPYEYQKESEWTLIQCGSYLDCIKKHLHHCEWIAFLDCDEFLFSPTKRKLTEVLKLFEDFSCISVNWIMYGTSNVDKVPDGQNITDWLVYRSSLSYRGNRTCKSIVRPNKVQDCLNPHWFKMKDGLKNFSEKGIETFFGESDVSVNVFRINHYWSRDKQFFFNEKIPRRIKWYPNPNDAIFLESCLNEEYDPILSSSRIN